MTHLPNLLRLLALASIGYLLWQLIAHTTLYGSMLLALTSNGVLAGLSLFFSAFALLFADDQPGMSTFALTGAAAIAALW